MSKTEEDPQEDHPLVKHPYTQIQLSDREKFHTGMLKLTLDLFEKEANAKKCLKLLKFN